MSKTVDDLVQILRAARNAANKRGEVYDAWEMDRAGIAAVVRALRDEMRYMQINRDSIDDMFNEILGTAGDEKVGTHGSPELDEDARKLEAMGQDPGMTLEELLAPATDPAPAVCVWVRAPYTALYSSCCDEDYLHNVTDSGMCHRCGKPIKFTEAKT